MQKREEYDRIKEKEVLTEENEMKIAISNDLMRRSDRATIEAGTPSRKLMHRAAEALSRAYSWESGAVIVCGVGNNAGDGYALASILKDRGVESRLVLLEECFSEDGAFYFEECRKKAIPWELYSEQTDLSDATAIADCIFGTGFRGCAEGRAAELIRAVNEAGCPVISADINSGMSGDSGLGKPCVHSTRTVAIGSYKYGHFLGNSKDVIGSLTVEDIGIPVLEDSFCLVPEASDFSSVLRHRSRNSHKGDYGYVGILAGCTEYSGAAKLANLSCAALRSGCGVSTLAVPQSLAASVSPYLLESTLMLIPDDGAGHMVFDAEALDALMKGRRALAVGMGWGRSPENKKILVYLLERYEGALVIDADGLNTLAEMDVSLLRQTGARVFLTPHPKEFERLSGYPVKEILQDPVTLARRYATDTGACVLLKGACTVITDGKTSYLVDRGCAGMATAGSGDVLSGILAGLLGYAPADALTIACGAYLAGVAGELAEADSNAISMTASDTVRHLSKAISTMI